MSSKIIIDHVKNCHGITGTLRQISKQIPSHPESIYLQPSLVQNNLICLNEKQDYTRLDVQIDDKTWKATKLKTKEEMDLSLLKEVVSLRVVGVYCEEYDDFTSKYVK